MRRLKRPLVKIDEAVQFIEWEPEKLREMREYFGLSQQDIATVLHTSQPTISSIERDGRPADLLILYGIVMERICAYRNGYIASFRRIGRNDYISSEEAIERH